MTTNHIKNLDEALIRTGRADRIITFIKTPKRQAEDMFTNAYNGTRWGQHMSRGTRLKHPEKEDWTDEDIYVLAKEFSDKIQDSKFGPALIQQYFKNFRAEPRRAVQELEKWMRGARGYRRPSLDRDIDALLIKSRTKREKMSLEEEDPGIPPTMPRN